MAFCTSCGAQVSDTSQFCTKCGKPLPVAAPANLSTPTAVGGVGTTTAGPPRGGSNALTIAVIIIAVVIGLGLIAAGITAAVVHRIARHSRVTTTHGGTRVETPFGTIQTSTDAATLSAALKDDMYPGATVDEGGSDVNMGGKHVISANLATSDPPDKVADYYKQKHPDSITSDAEGKHTLVSKIGSNMLSLTIDGEGGKTRIHISRITR